MKMTVKAEWQFMEGQEREEMLREGGGGKWPILFMVLKVTK